MEKADYDFHFKILYSIRRGVVASNEAMSRPVLCVFIAIYSFFCLLAVRLTVTVLFITCDRLSVFLQRARR